MAKRITKKAKVEKGVVEEVVVGEAPGVVGEAVEASKTVSPPETETTPPTLIEQLIVQRQISKNL